MRSPFNLLANMMLLVFLLSATVAFAEMASLVGTSSEPVKEESETEAETEEQPSLNPADASVAWLEIERLENDLKKFEDLSRFRDRFDTIQEQYSFEIERFLNSAALERIDKSRLDVVQLAIVRQRSAVSRLLDQIKDEVDSINVIRQSLSEFESTWGDGLDPEKEESLPQELVELIGKIADKANISLQVASARLGELVVLESEVLTFHSKMMNLDDAAQSRERAILVDMFRQDAEPVWISIRQLSLAGMTTDLRTVIDMLHYGVRDVFNTYGGRLFLHGIGGVIVLLLLLAARRNPDFSDQIGQSAAQRVIEHPIAMAVVITLAFTQLLYPSAQPSVVVLSTAVFIVAELIVLGALLKGAGWLKISFIGIYLVVMRAMYLLPYDAPLHRLAMLVGALAGLALLIATWRIGRVMITSERWRTTVGFLLSLLGLLLATAVVAHALGAVTYASFIVEAVILCYLSALGLLTLSIISRDLVAVALGTKLLQLLRSVRHNSASITLLVRKFIVVFAVIYWILEALNAFRLLEPLMDGIQAALDASLQIGQVSFSLGSILVFIFAIWLAVYVSRVMRFFLNEDVLPRIDLPRGVPAAISTGAHYVVILIAVFFGTAAAGLDLTKLAIVIGALSVGIGFGLQTIVNNFVSGLILLLERPIQVGDFVQVGSLMGRVTSIGIRASTVRTPDGSEVIVPNGDLVAQQVVNYTLSDRDRRIEVNVGVAYGTDLDMAIESIESAVSSVPLVSETPKFLVLFQGFGDSSLDFRILFWIDDFEDGLTAKSDVGIAVNNAFKKAGIEIPFPQRDVNFRNALAVDTPGQKGGDAD